MYLGHISTVAHQGRLLSVCGPFFRFLRSKLPSETYCGVPAVPLDPKVDDRSVPLQPAQLRIIFPLSACQVSELQPCSVLRSSAAHEQACHHQQKPCYRFPLSAQPREPPRRMPTHQPPRLLTDSSQNRTHKKYEQDRHTPQQDRDKYQDKK